MFHFFYDLTFRYSQFEMIIETIGFPIGNSTIFAKLLETFDFQTMFAFDLYVGNCQCNGMKAAHDVSLN